MIFILYYPTSLVFSVNQCVFESTLILLVLRSKIMIVTNVKERATLNEREKDAMSS